MTIRLPLRSADGVPLSALVTKKTATSSVAAAAMTVAIVPDCK